jgi:hypothetical protein
VTLLYISEFLNFIKKEEGLVEEKGKVGYTANQFLRKRVIL